MPTKDELETRLYERMSQENKAFLTEMKAKSPDEIISHAYEIACRDNLLILFEDETSLSERQLTVLNEFEHPLSQLYTDWLSRDTDEMDAFRDSIACCADDILRKRVEEKYRDPAQPIYPNTRSEAMARGEVFEWMASRDRTLTCAGTFEAAVCSCCPAPWRSVAEMSGFICRRVRLRGDFRRSRSRWAGTQMFTLWTITRA